MKKNEKVSTKVEDVVKDAENKVEDEAKGKTVSYDHEWGQGSRFMNPKYKNLQPYVPGEQLPEGVKEKEWASEEIRYTKEFVQRDIDKLMGKIDYTDFLSLNMDSETIQLFKEAYAEIIIYTKKLTNSLSKIQSVAEEWEVKAWKNEWEGQKKKW